MMPVDEVVLRRYLAEKVHIVHGVTLPVITGLVTGGVMASALVVNGAIRRPCLLGGARRCDL